MKKRLLAILPITFLFCSCSLQDFSIFGWQPFGPKDDQNEQKKPIEPSDTGKHATSISLTPSTPFMLKIGESRELSISFDQLPDSDDEKIFTWELTGDAVTYVVNESNTRKATVTGAKEGSCSLKVTNTYNHLLTKSFTIKVIDFVEDRDYLWQYATSDRAQFGYVSGDKPQGDPTGTAVLNGYSWSFTRKHTVTNPETQEVTEEPYVSSLWPQSGGLGFGKNQDPETHIRFELENTRTVNSIFIEAASANSLAKMNVTVGETKYMDDVVVPRVEYSTVPSIASNTQTSSSGNIVIDIVTPEFDLNKSISDPDYLSPGAFILKSILIRFADALPAQTLTLVKNSSEVTDGCKYLIFGSFNDGYGYLDGTLSTGLKSKPYYVENFELNNSIELPNKTIDAGFTASIDTSKTSEFLNFTSDKEIKIGLNGSGGVSITKDPANLGWSFTVDESGHFNMYRVDPGDSEKQKYFGAKASGEFKEYASAQNNIYLYKFAD